MNQIANLPDLLGFHINNPLGLSTLAMLIVICKDSSTIFVKCKINFIIKYGYIYNLRKARNTGCVSCL